MSDIEREHADEIMRLAGLTEQAQKRATDADRQADLAFNAMEKVRDHIRTVQAIQHLRWKYPQALGGNVDANIEIELSRALSEIKAAEDKADRIPF